MPNETSKPSITPPSCRSCRERGTDQRQVACFACYRAAHERRPEAPRATWPAAFAPTPFAPPRRLTYREMRHRERMLSHLAHAASSR